MNPQRRRPGARRCARPGCTADAVATLRLEATRREAWLVGLDAGAPRVQGDLCEHHAATVELPKGWVLHDGRGRDDLVPPPDATPTTRHLEQDEPAADTTTPSTDEAGADETGADETATDERAPDDDLLDAQTPLLSRAFRNAWPR